ncbi:hypothetical protein COTS27_00587 [Spirochaetota bacterium]|nr:hypothetical protein COTS27_00587 [Spirochaetota bacterium]
MIKKTLLFFVEEKSAKEVLDVLMQRIQDEYELREVLDYKIIDKKGKDDLRIYSKQLFSTNRIEGFRKLYSNPIAIVIYDNDNNKDCKQEKENWAKIINSKFAKVVTLNPNNKYPFPLYKQLPVVIRVACQELESFFLGDVKAVNQALGTKLNQEKGDHKDPDKAIKPSDTLSKNIIYRKGKHPQRIANHLEIEKEDIKNKSSSYKLLLTTIHILINYSGKFSR